LFRKISDAKSEYDLFEEAVQVMEGFGQTGEMQADDEAVRSYERIDFSENESTMQLGKGVGGTGNGQVNGTICLR
jgi:hypothetical protein